MGDTLRLQSGSVEDTMRIGAAVAAAACPGDVVALIGELGAGKTQFVRGMAQGLGIHPRHVSSPTFVVAQEYESDDGESLLVHIDAYRLAGEGEFDAIGYGESGGLREEAVTAVEWADRVTGALGVDRLAVFIEHDDAGRRLLLEAHGRWRPRLDALRHTLQDLQSDA